MIRQVDVDELASVMEGESYLLDVRMPDEYEQAHVVGAVLIPLPELPARLDEIPSGGTVHIICRSGARSMNAAEFLAAQGREAVNVAGGTMAWIESGRPVETGADAG